VLNVTPLPDGTAKLTLAEGDVLLKGETAAAMSEWVDALVG
jgi:hypothetical protein